MALRPAAAPALCGCLESAWSSRSDTRVPDLITSLGSARSILKEYRGHPTLQVSLYRYWRHSPNISCLLQ